MKANLFLGLALLMATPSFADYLNYEGRTTSGPTTFKVYLGINRPKPAAYPSEGFANGRIETNIPGDMFIMQSGALKDGGSVDVPIYFSNAAGTYTATHLIGRLNGTPGRAGSTIVGSFNVRYYNHDYIGVPVTLSLAGVPAAPTATPTAIPTTPVFQPPKVTPVVRFPSTPAFLPPKVTPITFPTASVPSGTQTTIFDTSNTAGVLNNPRSAAVFSRSKPFTVTNLWTYHWNNARGASAGSVSLRDSAGHNYGPWRVSTSDASGGRNVNWTCSPNVTLPAGTYTVIDSDNSTWSQNSGSAGRGFVRVTAISQ
jgi:hypothetical protein